MLFEYPYRLYRIGYALYVGLCLFALYFLFSFPVPAWLRPIFILFIAGLLRLVYRYYAFHYQRLAAYAIRLEEDELIIRFEGETHIVPDERIRMVYYSEQIEQIKVYHVLHLFTMDNRHFYFSNELIRFRQLVRLLEARYPSRFRRIDHLLKNFREQGESAFYQEYLRNDKS